MTDIRMEPLHEASVWTGDQLQDDHSWEYPLDDSDRAELAAALDGVKETRLEQITAENFPLSGLEGRLCELSAV